MIEFRPARPHDFDFVRNLYVKTLRSYASTWESRVDEGNEAEFATLWRPQDTNIILCDDEEVGWLEIRETEGEVFLKQFYMAPAHQRRGIGSRAMRWLIEEWQDTGKPMALFVLKNNPARRLYERFGFKITSEIDHRLLKRRAAESQSRYRALACACGGFSRSGQ